jgi:sn-glycerol 3-phosphate transport system permease protein
MSRKLIEKGAFLAVNSLMAALILAPLLYCVSVSFMTEPELFSYPPAFLPHQLRLDNYMTALAIAPIFRFIMNSMVVAAVCTAGQLFFGALAGYAFAMHEFPGKRALFLLMLSTMMIPGQAIIIANYLTIANLHLTDSYPALILPYLTSAFCLFSMRQAFLKLPSELYESAALDGCGSLTFFMRIGLPLVKPSLGSLGVYTFLAVWNQYLWPLLVTNKAETRTVQIGIGMLQNSDGNAYGPIMAGVTMVLIPSVMVFLIGQKSLISGLTAGAIKG